MMTLSKRLAFTKMVGTGNDFIVFDNRDGLFTGEEAEFFASLCHRRLSVGADGVVLVENGKNAPVRMRIFNSDGKEAGMCGNAARCVGYFSFEKKIVRRLTFDLEANDGVHRVAIEETRVTLQMARPKDFKSGFDILREPGLTEGGYIDTGVPHYVVFVEDVDAIDVEKTAPYYRSHPVFPEGANVNFVQFLGSHQIRVRTFERGVEGETLSCGTGSVASALIASKQFQIRPPVAVLTRGGELLVAFDEAWKEVTLTGRVEKAFEGTLPNP